VARNTLSEAGVIYYTPGGAGHAKKTMYRICKCKECQVSEQIPLNSKALKKKKV